MVSGILISLVSTYLGVVLSITSVQRNGFEIKPTVQVDRSDDVSFTKQALTSAAKRGNRSILTATLEQFH